MVPRYYFNAKTGVCQQFIYGGCGGNENNFETVDACYDGCGGTAVKDVTSCANPWNCTVGSPNCCGCDQDAGTLVAIRADAVDAYRQSTGCVGVMCEPCMMPDPTTHTTPYFGATCRAGRCVLYDARETEMGACQTSVDCTLRNGLGCCERCGISLDTLISVNRAAPLPSCGSAPACPPCMPAYPQEYGAMCTAGRCVVSLMRDM
jgi:hypothetical protein